MRHATSPSGSHRHKDKVFTNTAVAPKAKATNTSEPRRGSHHSLGQESNPATTSQTPPKT